MNDQMSATILKVIDRAPPGLRNDLESTDAAARGRAEETWAAMISDALAPGTGALQEQ